MSGPFLSRRVYLEIEDDAVGLFLGESVNMGIHIKYIR